MNSVLLSLDPHLFHSTVVYFAVAKSNPAKSWCMCIYVCVFRLPRTLRIYHLEAVAVSA